MRDILEATAPAQVKPRRLYSSEPTQMQLGVLRGLQGKHVYGGTVPDGERAARRAKNKVARASRRANRGSK